MRASPSTKAFTLVEILVVMVIIGITIGFALLSFGDFGSKRKVSLSADQLVSFIQLVRYQAILETTPLGIKFDKNQYQATRFKPGKGWQPMSEKSIFKSHTFPKETTLTLNRPKAKNKNPDIIIQATGDMLPFRLLVKTEKHGTIKTLIGKSNGTVLVQ